MPSRHPSARGRPGERRARLDAQPPSALARSAEVVLDVDVDDGLVHLVLANCGDAVATDIRVEFSRALTGLDGVVVSDLPVFKRLGVLRPGRTLRIFWDTAPALLARRDDAAPFTATVSWSERLTRTRQRSEYDHDPSMYRQLPVAVAPKSG